MPTDVGNRSSSVHWRALCISDSKTGSVGGHVAACVRVVVRIHKQLERMAQAVGQFMDASRMGSIAALVPVAGMRPMVDLSAW